MEHVIYKGEYTETYELLSHGYIHYVPMPMSSEKAHKLIERRERRAAQKERFVSWLEQNDTKVHLVEFIALIAIIAFIVWLIA